MKKYLLLTLLLFSANSLAGNSTFSSKTITNMYVYGDYAVIVYDNPGQDIDDDDYDGDENKTITVCTNEKRVVIEDINGTNKSMYVAAQIAAVNKYKVQFRAIYDNCDDTFDAPIIYRIYTAY